MLCYSFWLRSTFLKPTIKTQVKFHFLFSLFVILLSKNCHTVTLFPENYIFIEAQITRNHNFPIIVFIFPLGITEFLKSNSYFLIKVDTVTNMKQIIKNQCVSKWGPMIRESAHIVQVWRDIIQDIWFWLSRTLPDQHRSVSLLWFIEIYTLNMGCYIDTQRATKAVAYMCWFYLDSF
jgi:hypothetical protein